MNAATRRLDRQDIERILPHRYENLLIDEEEISFEEGINKGLLNLLVSKNDPAGRDVFLKKGPHVFIEPVYMEILALCSIVSMGELPEGVTAFFSAITNYRKTGDGKLGELLLGETEKGRAKGDFHRFKGCIKDAGGGIIAQGDLMAFAMKAGTDIPESDKKVLPVPVQSMQELVSSDLFYWKSAEVTFADAVILHEDDAIAVTYTYPADHRFVKGHFPGNPVMMGITQWIAAADALYIFADQAAKAGRQTDNLTVTADVDVMRDNGVVTAEIKGCTCSIPVTDGVCGPLSVEETKKLYFRDVVKPGDRLIIHAKNIRLQRAA